MSQGLSESTATISLPSAEEIATTEAHATAIFSDRITDKPVFIDGEPFHCSLQVQGHLATLGADERQQFIECLGSFVGRKTLEKIPEGEKVWKSLSK